MGLGLSPISTCCLLEAQGLSPEALPGLMTIRLLRGFPMGLLHEVKTKGFVGGYGAFASPKMGSVFSLKISGCGMWWMKRDATTVRQQPIASGTIFEQYELLLC